MTKFFSKSRAHVEYGDSKMGITQVADNKNHSYAQVQLWNGEKKYYKGNSFKTNGFQVTIDGHVANKNDTVSGWRVPKDIKKEIDNSSSSFKRK